MTWGRREGLKIIDEQDLEQLLNKDFLRKVILKQVKGNKKDLHLQALKSYNKCKFVLF